MSQNINKNELALKIGLHILDSIQKMQEDKKEFGRYLEIPFRNIEKLDAPEWIHSIQLSMPRFVKIYYDGDARKFESITMAEYYGWDKK